MPRQSEAPCQEGPGRYENVKTFSVRMGESAHRGRSLILERGKPYGKGGVLGGFHTGLQRRSPANTRPGGFCVEGPSCLGRAGIGVRVPTDDRVLEDEKRSCLGIQPMSQVFLLRNKSFSRGILFLFEPFRGHPSLSLPTYLERGFLLWNSPEKCFRRLRPSPL